MPNPKLSTLTIPVNGVLTTFDLAGSGGESEIPSGAKLVKITQNDYNQLTTEEKMDPDVVYFVQDGGEAADVKLLSIASEPSKTGYDSSNYIFDTTGLSVELVVTNAKGTTRTDVTNSCTIDPANGTDLSTYLSEQASGVTVPVKVTYTDDDGNEYNKTFKLNVFSGNSGGGGGGEPISGANYRLGVYKKPNHSIYGTDDPILDLTGYVVWLYTDTSGSYDGTWDYAMTHDVSESHIDVTNQCTFDPPNGTDLSSRIAALRPDGDAYLPIETTYTYGGVTYDCRYPIKLYNGDAGGAATYEFKIQQDNFGLYGTDDFRFNADDGVSGTMVIKQGPYTNRIALSEDYLTVDIPDGTDMREYDPNVNYTTCTIVPVKVTCKYEGTTYEDYGPAYYLNAPLNIYELTIAGVPKSTEYADHLSFYQITENKFDSSVIDGSYLWNLRWKVDTSKENNGSYTKRSKIKDINLQNVEFTLVPDGTIVTTPVRIRNGDDMSQYAPSTVGAGQVYAIEAMLTYEGRTMTDTFYCKVWNVDSPEFKPEG